MDEQNAPQGNHPMDEFGAVQRLLAERPAPNAEVFAAARSRLERATAAPPNGLAPLHLSGGRHMLDLDRTPAHRRWRGWLAPLAAAAAVAVAVAVSVAISGTVGRHHARKPAASAAVFGRVPPYFVALTGNTLPDQGTRAVVVATASGVVLGQVSPPTPHSLFTWVTAAGDDRTFVLAVQHAAPVVGWPGHLSGAGPARFYRLTLSRSGEPGALTALPTPPVTGDINGFALSPDGSKLAVTTLPPVRLRHGIPPPPRGSMLQVFTLATGAERGWPLTRAGWLGGNKPAAQSLSWAGDSRTLLVQVRLGQGGPFAELRLLDTARPGGGLPAAGQRVPIPSADLSGHANNPPLALYGPLLMTGDGTKIVFTTGGTTQHWGSAGDRRLHAQGFRVLAALFKNVQSDRAHHASQQVIHQVQQRIRQAEAKYAKYQPTLTSVVEAIEVSVRTGKPALVLGRRQVPGLSNEWVMWTNAAGTALIVAGNGPLATQRNPQTELGVVTAGSAFTPLPNGVQALLGDAPAW
jgi:hypothetical protein